MYVTLGYCDNQIKKSTAVIHITASFLGGQRSPFENSLRDSICRQLPLMYDNPSSSGTHLHQYTKLMSKEAAHGVESMLTPNSPKQDKHSGNRTKF